MRAIRQVFQQQGDGPIDALGVDKVVVVEDEVELARRCGNLVEEGPRQGFDGGGSGVRSEARTTSPNPSSRVRSEATR